MEAKWEKRLGISSCASSFEKDDKNHSRYEPTGYAVLEELAQSGQITRQDVLIDYGCGKGRVGFYLNYALGCRCIGVEYDENLYQAARENLRSYSARTGGVEFVYADAETWPVPSQASCFYFFNPFSVRILQGVLTRILESYWEAPRRLRLFFYYMPDEIRSHMMAQDAFEYAGEISCQSHFHNADEKEKIVIFELG